MSDHERTPSLQTTQAENADSREDGEFLEQSTNSAPQNQRKRSRSPLDHDRDTSRTELNRKYSRSPENAGSRHRGRDDSQHDDREHKKPRRKDAGFKWKEKRRDDGDNRDRDEGLRRGYRDHYKPKRRSRSRSRSRDRERNRDQDRESGRYKERRRSRSRSPRRHDSHRSDRRDRDNDRPRDSKHDRPKREERASRPAAPAPAPAPSMPQQEMILVTVNDRLGTKKQIPCLPSDTIKDFKAVVAMMIGRRPHEILLKRQSERPFKDFLTLQDYGVSNGAQLDLEVDTGD